METIIMRGKPVADKYRQLVTEKIQAAKENGRLVTLAVIVVGDDPASQIYVRNKGKACEEVGFYSEIHRLPAETTEQELLALIDELNEKKEISGILVQLPLPKHLDEKLIINNIVPQKDVDAFHPVNVGKIMIGEYDFLPCTPAGVMELLKHYDIDASGKNCVVIGRSNIVGKPMASLLLERSATVTICHSRTKNLSEITSKADLIVAAVGRAKFVTADMVKEGAIVVDVGINRNDDGKLCGDVDFENVKDKCEFITPVPGGCGPMTIAVLMKNTLLACKKQNGII